MTRLFAILIAVGFLSVSHAGSSFADSDWDDSKHEQKHDKYDDDNDHHHKYKQNENRQQDERSSKAPAHQDSRSGNPVSKSLNAVSNNVNKAADKINQAKEWWQFW